MPKAITPATTASPGPDYEVVTIGFKESLNYPFVVEHSLSSAQIFDYLPLVLTFPFTADSSYSNVTVKRLVPYTASGIDYIITVAEVYFPIEAVSSLQLLVEDTSSKLYRNSDATDAKLASLIDNRIPLTGLDTTATSSATSSDNNGSMDSSNSPVSKKGVVAGVATGAAAGTIAYMSLMVLLFRRFKKKRNNIELPPSDSESNLEASNQVSAGTPSTENRPPISNPVNTFNSLGWSH